MSDFDTIQANLAGRIRTVSGFTVDNVLEYDNRALAKGPTRAVVLNFGAYHKIFTSFRNATREWMIHIDLYERWTGQQDGALANMTTDRQSIIDVVDQWPYLNNTADVYRVEIMSAGPIDTFTVGRTGYIRQRLVCRVREHPAITTLE